MKLNKGSIFMNLGKIIIPALIMYALANIGCGKENYIQFSQAQEVFQKGITKKEITKIFGQPVSKMEYEHLTTWYYDHPEIVEQLRPGEEWEAFKINFKEGVSYSIQRILITKRKSG
ncbi:MAG: hypothetical protein GVY36_01670 [Verrucomicrobia bacterium]|nr:hypothetical protein [Verrucomicrobiota bacterium]